MSSLESIRGVVVDVARRVVLDRLEELVGSVPPEELPLRLVESVVGDVLSSDAVRRAISRFLGVSLGGDVVYVYRCSHVFRNVPVSQWVGGVLTLVGVTDDDYVMFRDLNLVFHGFDTGLAGTTPYYMGYAMFFVEKDGVFMPIPLPAVAGTVLGAVLDVVRKAFIYALKLLLEKENIEKKIARCNEIHNIASRLECSRKLAREIAELATLLLKPRDLDVDKLSSYIEQLLMGQLLIDKPDLDWLSRKIVDYLFPECLRSYINDAVRALYSGSRSDRYIMRIGVVKLEDALNTLCNILDTGNVDSLFRNYVIKIMYPRTPFLSKGEEPVIDIKIGGRDCIKLAEIFAKATNLIDLHDVDMMAIAYLLANSVENPEMVLKLRRALIEGKIDKAVLKEIHRLVQEGETDKALKKLGEALAQYLEEKIHA